MAPSTVSEDVAGVMRWLWEDGGADVWAVGEDPSRERAEAYVRAVLQSTDGEEGGGSGGAALAPGSGEAGGAGRSGAATASGATIRYSGGACSELVRACRTGASRL